MFALGVKALMPTINPGGRVASPRKRKTAIELPRGVHRVMGRNRMPYYCFQPGRGTTQQRERIRLSLPVTSDLKSP